MKFMDIITKQFYRDGKESCFMRFPLTRDHSVTVGVFTRQATGFLRVLPDCQATILAVEVSAFETLNGNESSINMEDFRQRILENSSEMEVMMLSQALWHLSRHYHRNHNRIGKNPQQWVMEPIPYKYICKVIRPIQSFCATGQVRGLMDLFHTNRELIEI